MLFLCRPQPRLRMNAMHRLRRDASDVAVTNTAFFLKAVYSKTLSGRKETYFDSRSCNTVQKLPATNRVVAPQCRRSVHGTREAGMGAECSVPCSAQNSFDKIREMELQQAREAADARANEPGGRKWYERKGAVTGRCNYHRMRARRLPRAVLGSHSARPVARARARGSQAGHRATLTACGGVQRIGVDSSCGGGGRTGGQGRD